MRFIGLFSFLLIVFLYVFNSYGEQLPEVTNFQVAQKKDGSKRIDITYDIADPDGDSLTVLLKSSSDGGLTWNVKAISVTGDVGQGILPGKGKSIVWDAGKDIPDVEGDNYVVKMIVLDTAATISMMSFPFPVDTRDPKVMSTEPAKGATDISKRTDIVVRLSDDVDSTSISIPVVHIIGERSGESALDSLSYVNGILTVVPEGSFSIGEKVTVTLRSEIVDFFGNSLRDGDYVWSFTIGEHTPSLVIDRIAGMDTELSGTVIIYYTTEDPDGDDLSTTAWQYSMDGTIWYDIDSPQIGDNAPEAPGLSSITWNTRILLDSLDVQVWFRMKATDDLFVSSYATSGPFPIDNNDPPSAKLTPQFSGEQTTDTYFIIFNYELSDRESDTLSIEADYSLDDGNEWNPATFTARSSDIDSSKYSGILLWRTSTDIAPGTDSETIRFRLTPFDSVLAKDQGTPGESDRIHIDYNDPPSVDVEDILTPQTGDILIKYELDDKEKDALSIHCYYSIGEEAWKRATVDGGTTEIDSSAYVGGILWRSKEDTASIATTRARFRITVSDNDTGGTDETQDFDLLNNAPPEVELVEDMPEVAGGDIIVCYTLFDSENDPLSIRLEYWKDGEWLATDKVKGDTASIPSSSYTDSVLSLIWESRKDLPDEEYDGVRIKITPSDALNPKGKADSTAAFRLDNKPPESISADGAIGNTYIRVTFNEPVSKESALSPENYTLSDTFVVASVDSIPPHGAMGEGTETSDKWEGIQAASDTFYLQLSSGQRLPRAKRIEVTAHNISDIFGNTAHVSLKAEFEPRDPNWNPVVEEVITPPGEQSGNVTIYYKLSDVEGDTLSITCQYSTDSGATWSDSASVEGTTSDIDSASYKDTLSVVWNSAKDLEGRDLHTVRFRITPADEEEGKRDETDDFHVDDNEVPSVVMDRVEGEQQGDVPIRYRLSDAEDDTLSIICEYDSSGTWVEATVTGRTAGIKPFQYVGPVIWNSKTDLPETVDNIPFRIIPKDRDVGIADTIIVQLDNKGIPSIVLTNLSGEQSGDVQIVYQISDDEKDVISFICEYSLDSGRNWEIAAVTGRTAGIDSTGYSGSLIWNSLDDDLSGMDKTTVRFRITPSDVHTGLSDETEDFPLDNNWEPSVHLVDIEGTQTGDITIEYVLLDSENDTLDIYCAYSTDGREWQKAETEGDMAQIDSSNYTGSIEWKTLIGDLSTVADSVYFRMIPSDRDSGFAGTLVLRLDNVRPKVERVWLADTTIVQSREVEIHFQVTDQGFADDAVGVEGRYFVEGDMSGRSARIKEVFIERDGGDWRGSLIWESGKDLGEVDTTLSLEVLPRDIRDEGIPIRTGKFRLDSRSPRLVKAGGYFEGSTIELLFDESIDSTSAVDPDHYSLDQGLGVSSVRYVSPDGVVVVLHLVQGQKLPSDSMRVTVSEVGDRQGNRITPAVHKVFLPGNTPPKVIALRKIGEEEVGGEVEIAYELFDAEENLIDLYCEYDWEGLGEWRPIDRDHVQGKTVGIDASGYEEKLVWESGKDLGGIDADSVRFRITPWDAVEGESGTTVPFHLDNNREPSVVSIAVLDSTKPQQAWDIKISYELDDAEHDTLAISCQYSTDAGQTWHDNVTVHGDTSSIAPDYEGTIIWKSWADLRHIDQDGIRFRITPRDKERGQSGNTTDFYIRNLLGDYDGNAEIDDSDFGVLIEAWGDSNTTKNIGPPEDIGTIPYLVPKHEYGKIDFEDLTVFVLMWNWYFGQYGRSFSRPFVALSDQTSESPIAISPPNPTIASEDLTKLIFSLRSLSDVVLVSLELRFDPAKLLVVSVESDSSFGKNGANIVSLQHIDEKGIVVINMARLGGSPVGISEKVSFTKVTLQALSDLPTKIQAAYVVRNSKNNIIAEGCIEQELKVRSQLPETYALFQNYPNPFNPVTTIKYLLSETSRVTLKVYNILGQEVRILVDKEEKAGSYSVLWDGLDEGGEGVASGVYLCKLEAADGCFPRVKKMVLIK